MAACADAGDVAVADMGMSVASYRVLARLDDEGRLPVRVFVYLDGTEDAAYDPVSYTHLSVRALGRAGIAVAVAAPMRPALALWSRYATTTLLLPNAASEARRFASSVAEEATARGAIVALASTDSALWALSRWRSSLPDGCQRVLPPHEAVVFSLDRSALHDRARTLGVPCAVTYRIERSLDVEPVLLSLIHI